MINWLKRLFSDEENLAPSGTNSEVKMVKPRDHATDEEVQSAIGDLHAMMQEDLRRRERDR